MKNVYFPTTVIDGFFEDPDSIRDYALHQEYFDINHPMYSGGNNYPGKRSRTINELNPLLFRTINKKFMDVFFPSEQVSCKTMMAFQSINGSYGSGWVHRDQSIATAIIYLSINTNEDKIGTSIYRKKNNLIDPLHDDFFKDAKAESLKTGKDEFLTRKKLNDHFEEVISVQGLYNRAILFDSHLYHAAQNFIGNDVMNNRLSIVIFFDEIITSSAELFPIQRMGKKALTIV